MVGQLEFNGIKTYDDLGFVINDISIGNPSPILIHQRVPYQNGVYDFSEINGNVAYTTREIKVQLKLEKYEVRQAVLNTLYYQLVNKFMSITFSGLEMTDLKISWLEGVFQARVSNISDFKLLEEERIIELTFIAQPFRTWEEYEGNDIWDTFNFETDIAQSNKIILTNANTDITLYNLSVVRVQPVIKCSKEMSIIFKQIVYNLKSGYNSNVFWLEKGINEHINIECVIGNGTETIEFLWKREVI
jgi:hypothetical protein